MTDPRIEAAVSAALVEADWTWEAEPGVPSPDACIRPIVESALAAADAVDPCRVERDDLTAKLQRRDEQLSAALQCYDELQSTAGDLHAKLRTARADGLHEAAREVEAYLRKEHAAPIWWHIYDILHTLAGCTWIDDAGEDGFGEYDCQLAALVGSEQQ